MPVFVVQLLLLGYAVLALRQRASNDDAGKGEELNSFVPMEEDAKSDERRSDKESSDIHLNPITAYAGLGLLV